MHVGRVTQEHIIAEQPPTKFHHTTLVARDVASGKGTRQGEGACMWLVMGATGMCVSSIKYTTNYLCYMHWLSFISLTFIGILLIVHSLYFPCFCTAEALWTFMDSFQLYNHLVRIRSAA